MRNFMEEKVNFARNQIKSMSTKYNDDQPGDAKGNCWSGWWVRQGEDPGANARRGSGCKVWF